MRVATLPFESWSGNIDFYKGLVISNLQRRGVATLFTLGYLPHFSRRTVEDAVLLGDTFHTLPGELWKLPLVVRV